MYTPTKEELEELCQYYDQVPLFEFIDGKYADNWLSRFGEGIFWNDGSKYPLWIFYDPLEIEWQMGQHVTWNEYIFPQSIEDIKTLIRILTPQ